MERVEDKPFRFGFPDFAEVFVGCKAFESFEASGIVVSIDKVIQVCFELLPGVVMIPFDGSFLNGSVHALDLPGDGIEPTSQTFDMTGEVKPNFSRYFPICFPRKRYWKIGGSIPFNKKTVYFA
jgi:hypothetical protein